MKWIYGNIVDYKMNFKNCTSCFKRTRAVLLNTLCWIVTKIVPKCRHKRNEHVHGFEICFLLSFSREAGSPLPNVWLFFNIVFKQTIWLEVVILHKYPMESIKGSLMMVSYKDCKSDCKFLLCLFNWVI